MEALKRSLSKDKPVEIYVGDNVNTPSLTVPKSVLSNISEPLDELLRIHNIIGGNRPMIELPASGENPKAWEVFIFWAYKRRIPADDDIVKDTFERGEALVHTWLLAETLKIIELQDFVMLKLLAWCEEHDLKLPIMETALIKTRPSSPLRCLVVEEIAGMLQSKRHLTWADLHDLSKIQGFAKELLDTLGRHSSDTYVPKRLSITSSDGSPLWKKYMVGDGPSKHWVFDDE